MPDSRYTAKQGQYLAFIHAYTKVMRQPPAIADIARFFEVTPPSAYNMIAALERRGLVAKEPGSARSLCVLLPPDELPALL